MIGGLCILAIKPKDGSEGYCIEFFLKKDLEFLKEKFPESSYDLKEFWQNERIKALEFANAKDTISISEIRNDKETCKIIGTFYLRGIQNPLKLTQTEELRGEGTPEYCCEAFNRTLKKQFHENDEIDIFEFGGFKIRVTEIVAYNFSPI